MKLKETIEARRAMLTVIEEVMNDLERNYKWVRDNLASTKEELKEFQANYEGDRDAYEYTSAVRYKTEDIARYEAQIGAYETVIKTLEKLI